MNSGKTENSKIKYRITDDEKKLDRFFMENDLEYSDEHPVDTDRIMMWEAIDEKAGLAGGLALAVRQGEYIIDGIAVDERFRGHNVGGRLLALAVRESESRGAERIYLVARAPEFFRHYGFETVERKDAPEFFECLTCPQYGVSCHPEVMCLSCGTATETKKERKEGMRIILDGMGGDNAPAEIVKGAILASKEIEDEICIIGKEDLIKAELAKYEYDHDRITTEDATQVIEMDDAPVKAVRTKKDSSLVKGIRMVKNGEGDLFISAGSSGALMAGGLFILGRIQGIDRPAIASVYPILGQQASLLVDAGANSECKPGNLLEFGIMGSIYMEKVIGRRDPSVGLVNLGVEEGKGSTLTKAAYDLLKKTDINFIGNVEAREVPKGACDVIICDGFVGNVILKLTEGLAWNLFQVIKNKFTDGTRAKMGAILLKDKMGELKTDFDYSSYGGAPILGVKGPIVKMHGSSNATAVKNSILKAVPFAKEDVVGIIQNTVLEIEEIETSE